MNALPSAAPVADDPSEKPYPGYAREAAALAAKVAAANRAHAEPFPGPLLEAFVAPPPALHGFTLQPVGMGLVILLKRIDSPLLDVVRIMREELTREDEADESTPELATAARAARHARANARLAAEIKADDETFVETVYCFVRPIAGIRALLASGRDKFREAAQRELGDRLHPAQFAELQAAVSAHYAQSFATAVHYEPPKGKDDGTVFTPPPAAGMTASAGGSTSLAP